MTFGQARPHLAMALASKRAHSMPSFANDRYRPQVMSRPSDRLTEAPLASRLRRCATTSLPCVESNSPFHFLRFAMEHLLYPPGSGLGSGSRMTPRRGFRKESDAHEQHRKGRDVRCSSAGVSITIETRASPPAANQRDHPFERSTWRAWTDSNPKNRAPSQGGRLGAHAHNEI